MFDPTHDPTAKRAWNALLALCTVHGTRAYKPENIGRLKYAMTMAVDLAGAKADQTTREAAAPLLLIHVRVAVPRGMRRM